MLMKLTHGGIDRKKQVIKYSSSFGKIELEMIRTKFYIEEGGKKERKEKNPIQRICSKGKWMK